MTTSVTWFGVISLLKQPQRRDPFRDAELLGHQSAAFLSHKTGVDQSNTITAASDHKRERHIDCPFCVSALYQAGDRLVPASGIFQDKQVP